MNFQRPTIFFGGRSETSKSPNFTGFYVEVKNGADLFHCKSRHFFHHQHGPVLLVKFDQEPIEQVALLGATSGIDAALTEYAFAVFRQPLHLTNLLVAKVSLIDQGPNFLLAEVIPALIYSDLVEPCTESRTQIKALQRQIGFQKRLLRHILDVLAAAHDTADDGQESRLMNTNQLFIGKLVASLRTLDQFALGIAIAGGGTHTTVDTRTARPPPLFVPL